MKSLIGGRLLQEIPKNFEILKNQNKEKKSKTTVASTMVEYQG